MSRILKPDPAGSRFSQRNQGRSQPVSMGALIPDDVLFFTERLEDSVNRTGRKGHCLRQLRNGETGILFPKDLKKLHGT